MRLHHLGAAYEPMQQVIQDAHHTLSLLATPHQRH